MKLISGNLNYSSWSIRAVLVARTCGLEVEEEILPLGFPETREALIERTGLHTVPVLVDGDLIVRDSLAITEYLAEHAETGRVWPTDPSKRALARSVCAEMHSGFLALRSQMPVNIRANSPTPPLEGDLISDIARVKAIWSLLLNRARSGGPFLFGEWSAADAFYAPVVTRFRTYGYPLSGALADYSDAVWESDVLKTLRAEADVEPWEIEMGHLGPLRAWVRE